MAYAAERREEESFKRALGGIGIRKGLRYHELSVSNHRNESPEIAGKS